MKTKLDRGRIKSRVSDIYSTARICGYSHAQELDAVSRMLWAELGRKYSNGRSVYTEAMRAYAAGLVDAARDLNYSQFLEFCYVDADGVKFSTRKGAPRSTEEFYKAGRGCELGKLPGGHFWIENGKPYHVSGGVA